MRGLPAPYSRFYTINLSENKKTGEASAPSAGVSPARLNKIPNRRIQIKVLTDENKNRGHAGPIEQQ